MKQWVGRQRLCIQHSHTIMLICLYLKGTPPKSEIAKVARRHSSAASRGVGMLVNRRKSVSVLNSSPVAPPTPASLQPKAGRRKGLVLLVRTSEDAGNKPFSVSISPLQTVGYLRRCCASVLGSDAESLMVWDYFGQHKHRYVPKSFSG